MPFICFLANIKCKLSILKIEELHELQVACFMFKVRNGLMPSYFANVFFMKMQMCIITIGLLDMHMTTT